MVAQRAKRIRQPEINTFATLLEKFPLTQDVQPIRDCIASVLPLARKYNLSAYDAAYLELSIRRSAPLATLDRNLQNAARRARVPIFTGSTKAPFTT